MPGQPRHELEGPAVLHQNQFALAVRLLDAVLILVAAGRRVNLFPVEVLDIELEVGDSPGDAFVVPHDDAGQTREGDARHAKRALARDLEPRQKPQIGDADFEVHVTGEQRTPRGGPLAGDGPGVRTGIDAAGSRGEQRLNQLRLALFEQAALAQVRRPVIGEGAGHLVTNGGGIGDAPRPRPIAGQQELHRQAVAMRAQVMVDAPSVGRQRPAFLRLQFVHGRFRQAPQAQEARFPVLLQSPGAGDLGQFTRRRAAQRVHLPHAFLGGDKPLREPHVLLAGAPQDRNAPIFPVHRDRLADRRRQLSRAEGQRAVQKPIHQRASRQQDSGNQNVDIFEKPAGTHQVNCKMQVSGEPAFSMAAPVQPAAQ